MRIRWKLFWLLAAISLAPIVALRVNSQFALDHLTARLGHRVAAHLADEAQDNLRRLVEDHARLLASRRRTLALAVTAQALAVRQVLTVPANAAPADVIPTEAGRAPATVPGYIRLAPDGTPLPLPIDRDRLTLGPPPGLAPTQARERLAVLAGILDPLRRLGDQIGALAHFQVVVLADGAVALYPAIDHAPRRRDLRAEPFYTAALAADGPVWTPPQAAPGTNRVSVAVSARIAGADGGPAGVTAIVTPLDDLLASVTPPGHIAGHVESYLVQLGTGVDNAPALLVEAGQIRREHGHGWHAYVSPALLESPDTATLAAMAADVARGDSGVRRLTFRDQDSLAAYAPAGPGEALLQISPVEAVLAEDRAVAQQVADSVRRVYVFGSVVVGAVMLALLVVSLSASRAVTRPILALTAAARRLADGDFSTRVEAPGRDEIGDLGRAFNTVAPRLEAHVRLLESMALASEIQRSLLPGAPPVMPGLDLAATSRYCDETGGDYYDFFRDPGGRAGRLGLVVGDVTGHGLEAALLMTTARALLRPRVCRTGTPAEILADVNTALAADVYGTGRFMTLFYLELDPVAGTAVFARAGHDPAIRYDPATGAFSELSCRGMPLGVSDEAVYETGDTDGLHPGQVLLVGSDGLWEARNPAGEMFGKDRTREALAGAAPGGATAVRDALLAALDAFRGQAPLEDDVTLVVVVMTDACCADPRPEALARTM